MWGFSGAQRLHTIKFLDGRSTRVVLEEGRYRWVEDEPPAEAAPGAAQAGDAVPPGGAVAVPVVGAQAVPDVGAWPEDVKADVQGLALLEASFAGDDVAVKAEIDEGPAGQEGMQDKAEGGADPSAIVKAPDTMATVAASEPVNIVADVLASPVKADIVADIIASPIPVAPTPQQDPLLPDLPHISPLPLQHTPMGLSQQGGDLLGWLSPPLWDLEAQPSAVLLSPKLD